MQTRYKADALFVHEFLALIYAVPFAMISPSCQSELNGSRGSQSAWKMSLSQSTPGREVLLPKKCHMHFCNYIHLQQIKYRLLIKLIQNKSRHNFISNLSSAACFGFVSHLQAEYIIVVWTADYKFFKINVDYNAASVFDEIPSYIIMEYYKYTLKIGFKKSCEIHKLKL